MNTDKTRFELLSDIRNLIDKILKTKKDSELMRVNGELVGSDRDLYSVYEELLLESLPKEELQKILDEC